MLLRFRFHRVSLTTNVSRMYRAMELTLPDQNLHRFVWRQSPDEPLQDYRMTRVTFKVSASSFAANMSVKQNSLDHALVYPQAAAAVERSFYVDDGIIGADSIKEAIELQRQFARALCKGRFPATKTELQPTCSLASVKSSSGVSLYDTLLVGPTVHSPLINMLLRFRFHRVSLTTNVSRMYRAMELTLPDQNLHRFVWRQSPDEPLQDYRMTRVTFKVSASSFAANMSVKQNSLDHALVYPQAAAAMERSFYVDDGIIGADSIEEAIELQRQFARALCKGRFPATKTELQPTCSLASVKSSSGVSLNDTLLVGPTVHSPLINVLLRFWFHQVSLTTSVSWMYCAMELTLPDQNLHRFVWRQSPDEPLQDYRMTRVTFEVSASSFAANMSVKQDSLNHALVGVDYAGPVDVKYEFVREPTVVKAYIAMFVWLSVKALHLELVPDLTTEGFLAALRHFIASHKRPSKMWSDHGTNFIGATNEIKELICVLEEKKSQEIVSEFCSFQKMEWKFIPEHAPHFGGLWEAAVKIMKLHLKQVIETQRLTFEEFSTILTQVEACLNSHPLTLLHCDYNDIETLTPHWETCGIAARPLSLILINLAAPPLASLSINCQILLVEVVYRICHKSPLST